MVGIERLCLPLINKRVQKKYITSLCFSFLFFSCVYVFVDNGERRIPEELKSYTTGKPYVYEFGPRQFRNTSVKKIMLWTKFFMTSGWVNEVKQHLKTICASNCSLIEDTSKFEEADAIVFHLGDLYMFSRPPPYRAPHQVWVIFSAEPPSRHAYNGRSWSFPGPIFNWTLFYRLDATVHAPYGHAERMSDSEARDAVKRFKDKDFSKGKTRSTFGTISNCVDDVKRYRYIMNLRRITPIDLYGTCGNLFCERDSQFCEKKIKSYRFQIAFENSHCRDYVTEKYWSALQREKVPLVNWLPQNEPYNAPPKSYINMNKFKSMREFADYLNMLNKNDTEYNSYFEWKKTHKVVFNSLIYGFSYLCKALHDPSIPAQVVDHEGYFADDTCEEWSITRILLRRINNFIL